MKTTKQKIEFLKELVADQNNALIKVTCKDEKAVLQMLIKRNSEKIKKLEFTLIENDYFTFATEFTCELKKGVVTIEEYGEGAFELTHIKTLDKYIILYEILTGLSYEDRN